MGNLDGSDVVWVLVCDRKERSERGRDCSQDLLVRHVTLLPSEDLDVLLLQLLVGLEKEDELPARVSGHILEDPHGVESRVAVASATAWLISAGST